MAELNVNIGNLQLKNPVMTALGVLSDMALSIRTLWISPAWVVFL